MLYQTEHVINQYISIRIPTVGEVVEHEDEYFGLISMIVATPCDLMVQLDDMHINFTKIDEWELFCLLFYELRNVDTSLVFKDINLKDFAMAKNKQNGETILFNSKTGAVIDRAIHNLICIFLRDMFGIEKNIKMPANEEARKFMIDRARKKQQRAMSRKRKMSELESYIIALVNTAEFPYNYETVLDITIYQFYASLHQIIKKVSFDNLMIGCYAGTVNMKEIDQKDLSWIPV